MLALVLSSPAFNIPVASEATSRRALLQSAGAVALGMPLAAVADGANSPATVARAKGIYGSRIYALTGKSAADILAEENAFVLYLSGAYRASSPKKAELTALKKTIIQAAKAGDSSGAQAGLKTFISSAKIKDEYALDETVWNPKQRRNPGAPTTDTVMAQSATYGYSFYQPLKGATPGYKAK